MDNKENLSTFFNDLIFKPADFFAKYVDGQKPTYYMYVLALFVISSMVLVNLIIVRPFYDYMSYYISQRIGSIYVDLLPLMVSIILGGILALIRYYVSIWFYNLRIDFSRGTKDFKKAELLVLYSSIIPSIFIIFAKILSIAMYMIVFSADFNSSRPRVWIPVIFLFGIFLIYIALQCYASSISRKGVIAITNVDSKKAKTWFLTFPIVARIVTPIIIILLLIFVLYLLIVGSLKYMF